jgi:hypothetical protein
MSAVSDRTPTSGAVHRPTTPERLREPLRRLKRRWNEAELPIRPRRADWPLPLRRTYLVGLFIFLVELIAFCIWNEIEVKRFALSADFAAYLQGAFLFGHGHLSPESTSYFRTLIDGQPQSAWGNAGEFFMVPLGILYRIWPHVVLLKWVQSLALVAAQAIAFTWMCELVAARNGPDASVRSGVWLAIVGLILLVANPWFIWASSFDVHSEPYAVPFVIAAARDIYYGRGRAWIWAICAMLCSAVGITYVVATCVSLALTSRRRARPALRIALLGLVYFVVLRACGYLNLVGPSTFKSIINGGAGGAYGERYVVNGVKHYTIGPNGDITLIGRQEIGPTYGQLLRTVITHPFNVVKALWVNHQNMWGTVSAGGLIGLLWLPVTVPVVDVLFQGGFVRGFSLPSFQNIILAGLIAVGTVAVLISLSQRLRGRRQWIVAVLGGVLAVNTLLWGVVWFPDITKQWLDIDPPAASQLAHDQRLIGPNDEVLASQGVVGAFGARQWAYSVNTLPDTIEVSPGRRVWFILAPYEGIETLDPTDTIEVISQLRTHPGVRLVNQRAGVWLFEWTPPRGVHRLTLSVHSGETTPAWAITGTSGRVVQADNTSAQHVTNTGRPGYVIDRAYWREPAGHWQVTLKIAASARTNVEVWNATTSRLLKRVVLQHTSGIEQLKLPVYLGRTGVQPVINGWGPWSIAPILRVGYSLEVRVWTGGRAGTVNVYSTALGAAGG